MLTRSTSTWLDDERKDHINPKGPKQRNCSKKLQTVNLPTNDVENTNCTNKGKDLLLANKLQRTEWMLQSIKRHSRITLHRSTHPKWEKDKTKKSSYGLGWPSANNDVKISKGVNINVWYQSYDKRKKEFCIRIRALLIIDLKEKISL